MIRVGVLLSGCGAYDGTDVHEAVLTLLAIDRAGARAECLVPAGVESDAVDHSTGQVMEGPTRSLLVEAARLARGRVTPIGEARTILLSALIIPGGQGVARCLMEGAVGGSGRGPRRVRPDVAAFIAASEGAQADRRRSLAARSRRRRSAFDEDRSRPGEVKIDERNGIVWTPGAMASGRLSEMAAGIDRMVAEVLARAQKGLSVSP